jgi:hypothetical protein
MRYPRAERIGGTGWQAATGVDDAPLNMFRKTQGKTAYLFRCFEDFDIDKVG